MKHFDICGEAQCFSVCQIKDKCFIWTLFNILCVPLSCWTASWHSHSMLQFFLSCVGSPFQIVLSSMVKHFCICKYYSALFLSESRKKKVGKNCFLWEMLLLRNSIFHWNATASENFQPTVLKAYSRSVIYNLWVSASNFYSKWSRL